MNVKKIVFYVMCALLAIMIIVSCITIGKASNVVQSILNPETPQIDPTASASDSADATDGSASPTDGIPGATEDEDKTAHQHIYTEHQKSPATCTEEGYTLYKCSCGDVETRDVVDALGHSYGAGQVVTSCTEGGYTKYECSRCGHIDKRSQTPAAGHKFDIEEEFPATCEDDAHIIRKCSNPNCTETETEFISGTSLGGHKYTILKKEVAATCTDNGYTLKACSNPGCTAEPKKEELKATGHTFDQWKDGSNGKQTKCVNTSCNVTILASQLQITKEYRNEAGTHYVIEVGTGTGVNDLRQLYDYNIMDERNEAERERNPLTYTFDSTKGFVVEYTDEVGTPQQNILGFASNSLKIKGTNSEEESTQPPANLPNETERG